MRVFCMIEWRNEGVNRWKWYLLCLCQCTHYCTVICKCSHNNVPSVHKFQLQQYTRYFQLSMYLVIMITLKYTSHNHVLFPSDQIFPNSKVLSLIIKKKFYNFPPSNTSPCSKYLQYRKYMAVLYQKTNVCMNTKLLFQKKKSCIFTCDILEVFHR